MSKKLKFIKKEGFACSTAVIIPSNFDQILFAGILPKDEDKTGNISIQVDSCFARMDEGLRLVGCSFHDVVEINSFLSSKKVFRCFNEKFIEVFQNNPPVLIVVITELIVEDCLIELQIKAARRKQSFWSKVKLFISG